MDKHFPNDEEEEASAGPETSEFKVSKVVAIFTIGPFADVMGIPFSSMPMLLPLR